MRAPFQSIVGKTIAALFAALFAIWPHAALAAYPERPITLIVPWGAGGGTDAVARILGTLMEKDLGQPVNVVNRTGGSGVVGHQAISAAAPDGYTIGMITVEIGMMHHQGLTDLSGASYTPIALVNADPAGVQVRADAPYKNLNDLLAAVKANPGKFKASGTGQGGIWHLAIAGLLRDQKIDPASVPWVPSNGAAPGPERSGGRRRRGRAVFVARGARADRSRQGQEPGGDGPEPGVVVSQGADAEGRDRQQRGRWPPGAASRHPRASRPTSRPSCSRR